ncbi:hypothetical protein AB6H40_21005 [Providencia huaxiensis]
MSLENSLLLFLPFIAIDLIVSNVLLAMGMMMVSPMTILMPIKVSIIHWCWRNMIGNQ